MSQVVDTKVVEMQFDNSKFEKNIEVSLNSLKNLNKSIDDAGKNRNSLDELTQASDKLALSFDNMQEKKRISLNLFDMLAGVGTQAFNKITAAVSNFALKMADSLSGMQAMRDGFAEYELKMGSVQTILMGAKIIDPKTGKELTDTSERLAVVNQKLEDLNAYSDRTIYSFKDMTSNIGKFTNAGVNLDDAVDAIQGVANVAAISGANAGEASRAMYNFAQALSSGYVKLIDWKSIENANMATVDFKEELLKTALALGTVTKEGDMYVTTTTNAQGKVSEAFNATKMFNDSLAHQWMTTDVLTQTLKRYTDETTELGKKAFAAATEVKTFSQMIDTLKESMGSQWAQTFEIIFGDFNEAKALWTSLNNVLDPLLTTVGKVRNEILKTWKAEGGRDAMLKAFGNLFEAVKNLLSPLKDLWDAFTPNKDTTAKILLTLTKGFERLTAVVAKAAKVIGRIIAAVLNPAVALGNFVSKWLVKIIGLVKIAATKVVNFFKPITKAIGTFSNTVAKAFDNHIVSRVKAFQQTLSKTFATIKENVKSSAAVQTLIKAFKDLRAVVQDLFERIIFHASGYAKRFIGYLKDVWDAVSPLVSSAVTKAITKLADVILPRLRNAIKWVADKLQDLKNLIGSIDITNTKFYQGLTSLPEKIKALGNNKTFKSITTSVREFGSEAITFLSNKFSDLKDRLDAIQMPKGLSDVFEKIKDFIKSIFGAESIGEQLDTSDAVEKIAGEESGKKLTAFQKFLNGVSDAFQWFKQAAIDAKNALKAFIDFVVTNTPKALKALYTFFAGDDGILTLSDLSDVFYDITYSLSTLLSAIGLLDFGKGFKNISDGIGELTGTFNTFLKQAANKSRMSAIKDFAIAIGILAGALYVLSKIPAADLLAAVSALGIVGLGLIKFFDQISSTNYSGWMVAGNLSLAVLLTSIGVAMAGMAVSLGALVGALALLPKVIKQYNNLGDEFRDGMDRVKEVLGEIFEYIKTSLNGKYSLRTAAALFLLVKTLQKMRKVILDFAKEDVGDSMSIGLLHIQNILNMLGKFLQSVTLINFAGVNIGINLNTLGIAAMIWALGDLVKKIVPVIQRAGKIPISDVQNGLNVVKKILWALGLFITGLGAGSKLFGTNLRQWIGMALTIGLLTNAIATVVDKIKVLSDLANGENAAGFSRAIDVIQGIFIGLGILLAIIGKFPPTGGGTLFMLSVSIGLLCACVLALAPIANSKPAALAGAVAALAGVMLSLGGTLWLAGKASGQTKIGDIVKLIAIVMSMILLTNAIRRLAKSGSSTGGIVAAGAAIAGAMLAMGGAIKMMNGVHIAPSVLVDLALLTAAIWGVAYAIGAFKSSAGGMVEGAKQVEQGGEAMENALGVQTEHLAAIAKDAFPQISQDAFGEVGTKIREFFANFDLGESVRKMVETVKADAKNWAQDFIDIGTNLIDGISVAISDPSNVEKIKGSIKALGKALLDSFKLFFGINSPSTVMAEQGGFIIDGLVQGLMEYPEKLAGWIKDIGSFITDGIESFFTNVVEKGKGLAGKLGEGLQNGKRAVSDKASALGKAALEKAGKVRDWATKAASSANAFGEKLKNSKNPVKKAAGSMLSGALTIVGDMKKSFQTASSDASAKFASEIKAGARPATAAAKSIVTGAKSAFNNISSSFYGYGQNAAEGFRNGINSLIQSIANKAREMVRRAKEAAKSEQHSESPSKDFMQYGGWAAEGYALGMVSRKSSRLIEANTEKMVNTAKSVTSSAAFGLSPLGLDSNPALGSLAYAMGIINDGLDSNLEFSPTIKPVIDLSDVTRGTSLLNGLFGDRHIGATLSAAGKAQSDFDRTMANRVNAMSSASIDKLAKKIDSMTSTMNSRSLNVYNTIDGASDPGAFADELVRNFRLNARTV